MMGYFIKDGLVAFLNDLQIKSGKAKGLIKLTDDQVSNHLSGLYEWVDGKQVLKDTSKTNEEQIIELESTITARRLREALLGDADSIAFVADVEDQIEALR